jgi:hypothetical protein
MESNGSYSCKFHKSKLTLHRFVNFVKKKIRCIVDHKTTNLLFFKAIQLFFFVVKLHGLPLGHQVSDGSCGETFD